MSVDIYSIIAESSPYATFVFNLNTQKFIYSNKAFDSLINKKTEDLALNHILELVHAEDQSYLNICFQKLLEGTLHHHLEFWLKIGGQKKLIALSPAFLSLESEQIIIGYAADITAETSNLETLKKYANKKNSVLNILSHDLRGPLGIANTVTQVLDRKINDPELIRLTQTLSRILKQSIDMIDDLTGREFLETADTHLIKKRVNMAIKLKEYIEECQKAEGITKRKFIFMCTGDAAFLNVDEAKFMQVINNLMTNALKFTHNDGIISLTIKEQPQSVLFIFTDNGIGIPEQFHATLFEKFSDARRKGLHGEPTIGLGLSIVKTIIDWHNGRIWFESKENTGTTFYIEIPKD